MKQISIILVSVLILGMSVSAVAGEGHGRCKASAQTCLDKKAAFFKNTAWDGIHVDLGEGKPMTVKEVLAGSPGADAGVQVGDVLVSLNGQKLADMDAKQLNDAMGSIQIGQVATYVIKRDGGKQKIKVTMSEIPMEMAAKYVGEHLIKAHAGEKVAAY